MENVGLGAGLLVGGAVVAAYVLLRLWCVRHVPLGGIPRVLEHRVELGNRLMPAAAGAATVTMVLGAVFLVA